MVNSGLVNPGLDEPEPAAAARTGPGTTLNNDPTNNTRTAIQAPRLAFVRALAVPENAPHASFICSTPANPATLAARHAELDDALARLRQQ
jgi:hypothetical protein